MAEPNLSLEAELNLQVAKANAALKDWQANAETGAKKLNSILGGGEKLGVEVKVTTKEDGTTQVVAGYKKVYTAVEQIQRAVNKLGKTEPGSLTSIRQQINQAKQARDNIALLRQEIDKTSGRPILKPSVTAEFVAASQRVRQLTDQLKQIETVGLPPLQRLQRAFQQSNIISFGRGVQELVLIFQSLSIAVSSILRPVNQALTALAKLQGVALTFKSIGLGEIGSAKALSESTRIAIGLGVELDTVRNGFQKLTPVVTASGGSLSDVSAIMEALSSRFAVFGLSVDQARRVTNGFIQAFSKGKLQAEEFTQQIAEADPALKVDFLNAINSSAEALDLLGVETVKSSAELEKFVKDGKINNQVLLAVLPLLSKASILYGKLGKSATSAVKALDSGKVTITAVRNQLENLTQLSFERLASAFEPALTAFLKIQAVIVDTVSEISKLGIIESIAGGLGNVGQAVANVTELFGRVILGITQAADIIGKFITAFEPIGNVIDGLSQIPFILESIGVILTAQVIARVAKAIGSFQSLGAEIGRAVAEFNKVPQAVAGLATDKSLTLDFVPRIEGLDETNDAIKGVTNSTEALNDEVDKIKIGPKITTSGGAIVGTADNVDKLNDSIAAASATAESFPQDVINQAEFDRAAGALAAVRDQQEKVNRKIANAEPLTKQFRVGLENVKTTIQGFAVRNLESLGTSLNNASQGALGFAKSLGGGFVGQLKAIDNALRNAAENIDIFVTQAGKGLQNLAKDPQGGAVEFFKKIDQQAGSLAVNIKGQLGKALSGLEPAFASIQAKGVAAIRGLSTALRTAAASAKALLLSLGPMVAIMVTIAAAQKALELSGKGAAETTEEFANANKQLAEELKKNSTTSDGAVLSTRALESITQDLTGGLSPLDQALRAVGTALKSAGSAFTNWIDGIAGIAEEAEKAGPKVLTFGEQVQNVVAFAGIGAGVGAAALAAAAAIFAVPTGGASIALYVGLGAAIGAVSGALANASVNAANAKEFVDKLEASLKGLNDTARILKVGFDETSKEIISSLEEALASGDEVEISVANTKARGKIKELNNELKKLESQQTEKEIEISTIKATQDILKLDKLIQGVGNRQQQRKNGTRLDPDQIQNEIAKIYDSINPENIPLENLEPAAKAAASQFAKAFGDQLDTSSKQALNKSLADLKPDQLNALRESLRSFGVEFSALANIDLSEASREIDQLKLRIDELNVVLEGLRKRGIDIPVSFAEQAAEFETFKRNVESEVTLFLNLNDVNAKTDKAKKLLQDIVNNEWKINLQTDTREAELNLARFNSLIEKIKRGVDSLSGNNLSRLSESLNNVLGTVDVGDGSSFAEGLRTQLKELEVYTSAATKTTSDLQRDLYDNQASQIGIIIDKNQQMHEKRIAQIEREIDAVTRYYDKLIKAEEESRGPNEARLEALRLAELQQKAQGSGREGLEARAQLESLEREKKIAELQKQKAAELEKLEAKRRAAEEQFRQKQEALLEKQSALQERSNQIQLQQLQAIETLLTSIIGKRQSGATEKGIFTKDLEQAQQLQSEVQTLKTAVETPDGLKLFPEGGGVIINELTGGYEILGEAVDVVEDKVGNLNSSIEQTGTKNVIGNQAASVSEISSIEGAVTDVKTTAEDVPDKFESAGNSVSGLGQRMAELQSNMTGVLSVADEIAAKFESVFNKDYSVTVRVNVEGGNRKTGGPVMGGIPYTVNEAGQEAFVDTRGNVNPIKKGAFGTFTPKTDGFIIPADIWADMKGQRGPAINERASHRQLSSPGASRPPRDRSAAILAAALSAFSANSRLAMTESASATTQQNVQLGKLSHAIDALASKDWNVNTTVRTRADLNQFRSGRISY